MKKLFILFQVAVLFLTFTEVYSQGIWNPQTSGTTQHLYGLHFINANTGTVIGANGIILRTTNGGQTWIPQNSSTAYTIRSVFRDSGSYFQTAVGDGSIILRTTNGGTNWSSQTSGINDWLTGVAFTDINNGAIVGENGKILETTNGGTNWIQKTSGTSNSLRAMSILSPRIGFTYDLLATGDQGTILKRTFGDYTLQNSGTNYNLYGVSLHDSSHATTVGQFGTILRTTNGGANWFPQYSNSTSNFYSVFFTDSSYGIAVGETGTIRRTTNGGINWNPQYSGTTNTLRGVYFANANTGYAVGDNGTILKTTNGGVWVNQISSEIPEKYSLYQNYPNPFNPKTKIKIQIAKVGNVKLIVYDALGREVETLIYEQLRPGIYEVEWNGSNFTSGAYFYRIKAGNFIDVKKMILLK